MKTFNFVKKLRIVLFGGAILCSGLIFSQIMHEADNCKYTGNSADYCNASDGQQNLKILNCKPGTTSCYY